MRRIGLLFALLLVAVPAAAQTQNPDYSRNKLIQIFANDEAPPKPPKKIDIGIGYIDFRALGMRWRIGYLPFYAPLYGSMPWSMNGAFGGMPDPFISTGMEIPQTPRTWAQNRAFSAELKRIERTEKEKAKAKAAVVVKPE